MDGMELKEFLGNMRHLAGLLHREWERSGRTEAAVPIRLADREAVWSGIAGEIRKRQKQLEASDLDFGECMVLSKENFVFLRLAKKIKKAGDEAAGRGDSASFVVEMDSEEYGLFRALFEAEGRMTDGCRL